MRSPSVLMQPTPLINRVHEIQTILQRLFDKEVHLLTLTGPPESGKRASR